MTLRRAALLACALALRAFPAAARADYGQEVLGVFATALDVERARGAWPGARFAAAAIVDLIAAGLAERRRTRTRTRERFAMSWLDVKLGFRMLVRYPGLSLAGGLGIMLVVICGAVAGLFDAVINGTLPFDHGERIVAIENWDTGGHRPAAHDFFTWRDDLSTIRDIGAWRPTTRNVASGATAAEPVRVAEISAAAFAAARVAPVEGRYLLPEDERPGATAVVVIGYDEWQRRFAGDPAIVGRTIQLGDTPSTVVGIMPARFGFPVNERYWIPLRLERSDYAARPAPSTMPYKSMPSGAINVFGRLADSVTLAAAQAELDVVGMRAAAAAPATHAHIRPRVYPYTFWFFREQHDGELFLVWGLVALVLVIVGANVAVLVYARTATRRVEIALRTAIGASRPRIVGQLFAEGLVLSGTAAAGGLLVAVIAQRELSGLVSWEQMPFWIDTSITSPTVLTHVLAVAVLGAVIVGVMPALQATGRRAQTGLQQAAAGSSGWRIGHTYGALIVVQVALAVAILPYALSTAWTSIRNATAPPAFPADRFLTARVDVESGGVSGAVAANARAELLRRTKADADVASAVLLAGAPGTEPSSTIEIDAAGTREIGVGPVDVDFAQALGVAVLSGRAFDARDLDPSSRHVIVNRTFAERIVSGDAVGRLIRDAATDGGAPGPWLEIVGVVDDVHAKQTTPSASDARIYRPVAHDDPRLGLLALNIRRGAPSAVAGRLRALATAVDRRLLLRDIRPMDEVLADQQLGARIGAWAAGLATASLLLLSAMGLYALMAFSVAQRRREIGIRIALGASPRAVVRRILSRSLWQLAIGIAAGVAIAAAFDSGTAGDFTGGAGLRILPFVAAFVLLIGVGAAAGPVRRALRIEPTEALRSQ